MIVLFAVITAYCVEGIECKTFDDALMFIVNVVENDRWDELSACFEGVDNSKGYYFEALKKTA
jgi:hypothetical protein